MMERSGIQCNDDPLSKLTTQSSFGEGQKKEQERERRRSAAVPSIVLSRGWVLCAHADAITLAAWALSLQRGCECECEYGREYSVLASVGVDVIASGESECGRELALKVLAGLEDDDCLGRSMPAEGDRSCQPAGRHRVSRSRRLPVRPRQVVGHSILTN